MEGLWFSIIVMRCSRWFIVNGVKQASAFHVRYSSFIIIDLSIQMVRRHTISAARLPRHAQGVRTVHKEGLQLDLMVILLKVLFPLVFVFYIPSSIYRTRSL
jgi:hypothetical protein